MTKFQDLEEEEKFQLTKGKKLIEKYDGEFHEYAGVKIKNSERNEH